MFMLVGWGLILFDSLMMQFLEALGTTFPVIRCNIPEDLNLESFTLVSQ
jgi:hypothetical protein